MKLKYLVFSFVYLVLTISVGYSQPTINAGNWPYGVDQIGNYWDYYFNSSNVAVSIATINPYQLGGSWNFSTGPTELTAGSDLMDPSAAPGPIPANTSYVEYQVAGGSSQWVYEDEDASGTWSRGFSQGGTVYNYTSPYWNIYHYPMTYATQWSSAWTWEISGLTVDETRANEIVGYGTVTTPFGGPMPCLVMRTQSTTYAEFMGMPVIDEAYRIYEWIVLGIGSVTTIQSINHETSWYFNTAAGYYRLYGTNLGGDLIAPSITNVTDLDDTPSPGPYTIYATIADASGIDSAAIRYSIAGGAYQTRGPVGAVGNVYTFQIPQLSGSPIQQVRYYIWARDASMNHNQATNPTNAPSSYYSFNWIFDNLPPNFTNVTIWSSPTTFNGPYPVQASITDDNGVLVASLHYKFGSGSWQESVVDSNLGNQYYFAIPAITATTIIRYYLEAVDNSGFFNTGYYPTAGSAGPIVFQARYTPPGNPQAIDDLTIRINNNNVLLGWTPITHDVNGNLITISYYQIYRGQQSDGSDAVVINTTTNHVYTDTGVVSGNIKYFYNVRAVAY